MARIGSSTKEFAVALEHAWDWFELHANQRMQLVNFWLLSTAFIFGGLVGAVSANQKPITVAIAGLGALTTIGFYRLEQRTLVLVKAAESVLKELQRQLADDTGVPEIRIIEAINNRPRFLGSYKQIIFTMQGGVLLAYFSTVIYAVFR